MTTHGQPPSQTGAPRPGPTGDDSLAPPRKCIIQIIGFRHPRTALQVRPVGDENPTIGLCPQRPRVAGRGEAANENPDTGSHHLIVKRVDIAEYRFASSSADGA